VGVQVTLRVMKKNYIYKNKGKVMFSTLGMKTRITCWSFYSTNADVITTNSLVKIEPVAIYLNADTQKLTIISDNKNKVGIYRWINTLNQKTYVGSSINLSLRFKSYFSMSYLEREILKNQSLIYRALLKNGYSNFRLEILEYCDPNLVLEREQYYLNTLNLEYNILKTAGSLKGFKHSEASIEQIRKIKKESNRKQPEEERIRQVSSLLKGESTIVINRVTGESTSFINSHGEWKLQYLLV